MALDDDSTIAFYLPGGGINRKSSFCLATFKIILKQKKSKLAQKMLLIQSYLYFICLVVARGEFPLIVAIGSIYHQSIIPNTPFLISINLEALLLLNVCWALCWR